MCVCVCMCVYLDGSGFVTQHTLHLLTEISDMTLLISILTDFQVFRTFSFNSIFFPSSIVSIVVDIKELKHGGKNCS